MDRLESLYHRIVLRPATPGWLAWALKVGALVSREVVRDQVPVRAATLAFWSLVAIVPVLVLAAAVVSPLGGEQAALIRRLLYDVLLAGEVESIGAQLDTWLSAVDFTKLGIVGFLGVGFTASRIYFSMEEAYNVLWNVRQRRRFVTRMGIFYMGVTVAPLLLVLGIALTVRMRGAVDVVWFQRFVPVLLTSTTFVGAIKALPNTEVRWVPALVGGVASALAFEAAKIGFGAYINVLGADNVAAAIYGSLGLFPIFLLWLFIVWTIVLLGVELAYVTQRLPDLMEAEDRLLVGSESTRHQPDALFAMQCLLVIARNWSLGKGPTPEPDVTRELHSEPVCVRAALEVLEGAGFLAASERGYLPAVPPDEVTVRDVIRRYRQFTVPAMAEDAIGNEVIEGLLGAPGRGLDQTVAGLVTTR